MQGVVCLKKDFISKHLCLFPTFPWSPRGIINFNILKLEILKSGEQAKCVSLPRKHIVLGVKKNCSVSAIIFKFPSFPSVPVGHMMKHASWLRPYHLFWNLCSLDVSTTWSCFSSPLIGLWEEADYTFSSYESNSWGFIPEEWYSWWLCLHRRGLQSSEGNTGLACLKSNRKLYCHAVEAPPHLKNYLRGRMHY